MKRKMFYTVLTLVIVALLATAGPATAYKEAQKSKYDPSEEFRTDRSLLKEIMASQARIEQQLKQIRETLGELTRKQEKK